jgi:hypothetical protein
MLPFRFLALLALLSRVDCLNFPFESVQLTNADIANFKAISFGNYNRYKTDYVSEGPECKAFPGTAEWPADEEWNKLNASLSGALLKPAPAAAVCYPGPLQNLDQCKFLLRNATQTRFYINDPLFVGSAWAQGNTCDATLTPTTNCTQGGFSTYVVNATTVKQIQIAVNFARNNNIRLVVK